ncbi:hypothetical protein A2303_04680 [Candidatus Falkowbacteria bacterium RIFOXYB2_FULL_47_14]|uniref:Glycosyl transferase family 11 n=1 Tax=Candidatus Falkowbacteria bacterium RIFOXYA2_FULL_47_19 TaxID=1797994 RepID=A0A1F5SH64_9BACT|nr:MAG: hypothetical protein A2227_02515 [Candidatus Falkowbacteria bacterium RIFOXYA2_FULL_47_19]OGF35797.1 MAG: hypothetical protein A2468_03700 [Candidatus Falkowbacteria bacterium RIFOXYC2_FULL_46_15]OGF42670.1 MAG: hypothetical protein A2303_04680 [Candidatus Falkowbacteria bacterium RIFOXYB2_FULL_47_14]
MIIVKIQGGLGNQLFQYAAGKNLATKNNTPHKLDITEYDDKNNQRRYRLNNFLIEENIATREEIARYRISGWQKIADRLKPRFQRKYIQYLGYKFNEDILKIKNKNLYFDGYWQSEKYFSDMENDIRKEFKLKIPLEKKFPDLLSVFDENSISLHIRRGDYLKEKISSIYGLLPPEYYYRALTVLTSKIKNPNIFVFSDDIPWTKKNLTLPHSTIFISRYKKLEDYEELILMSRCQHNIIANSSFSWWGAWLNENPKKIVIAPRKWFATEKYNHDELLPKNWLKL